MITAIPPEAAAWTNLEFVSFRRNKLTEVPITCMEAWTKLKCVCCSRTRLCVVCLSPNHVPTVGCHPLLLQVPGCVLQPDRSHTAPMWRVDWP